MPLPFVANKPISDNYSYIVKVCERETESGGKWEEAHNLAMRETGVQSQVHHAQREGQDIFHTRARCQ